MKGLVFSRNAVALYIKDTRFIAYFESVEDAANFAKKHYPNIEAHCEPITVYKFSENGH